MPPEISLTRQGRAIPTAVPVVDSASSAPSSGLPARGRSYRTRGFFSIIGPGMPPGVRRAVGLTKTYSRRRFTISHCGAAAARISAFAFGFGLWRQRCRGLSSSLSLRSSYVNRDISECHWLAPVHSPGHTTCPRLGTLVLGNLVQVSAQCLGSGVVNSVTLWRRLHRCGQELDRPDLARL